MKRSWIVAMPAGCGYRVRWYDSWNLLVDLMNHAQEIQDGVPEGRLYLQSVLGVGQANAASVAGHRPVRPLRILDRRRVLGCALKLERERAG